MKLHASIIFLILAVFTAAASDKTDSPSKELRELNRVINQSAKYSRNFDQRISVKKKSFAESSGDVSERVERLLEIASLYRQNMADSALAYASQANELACSSGSERDRFVSLLSLSDALSSAGFFSDARLRFDSLDIRGRDLDDRIAYFLAGRRLYSNLASYVGTQSAYHERYISKYEECDDSLLNLLPENDELHAFIANEKLVVRGRYDKAKAGLERLLSRLSPEENLYGMTAFQLATVYRNSGNPQLYAAYLAKAAESDIRGGVREGLALPTLAAWLYEQGKFEDAFKYINFALEDAHLGNARVRLVSMSEWVPLIDEAYRKEINSSRNELILFAVLVTLLLIALIVVVISLLKEIRKGRKVHEMVVVGSKMKDSYIGNFIGLCSTYSERYDSLMQLVDRKISSGQTSELLKMLRAGKKTEGVSEDFYTIIDSTIMNLYPDFVKKLNGLLRPDEKIEIPAGSTELNPELRIYAFVMLGVTESTKIARILNYSVNTVYAYRNRMRNRAVNRETFDDDVRAM